MRITRLRAAAAATVAATVATVLSPTAATAAVDVADCTYGRNAPYVSYTCTNPTMSGWYVRLECIRYANQDLYYVNGVLIWGSGTSRAQCGHLGEPSRLTIVNL